MIATTQSHPHTPRLRVAKSVIACAHAAIFMLVAVSMFQPAQGAQVDCARFNNTMDLQCLSEPGCVFDGHWCVATNDPCEIAWPELDGTQATCEAMTQCRYTKAEACYCPPDVDCVCGGGAPQQCRLED